MRAIRCHAYTGPNDLRLEEVSDPVPGPGQILIAVEACGLGFVDGLHVQGKYQVKIPLPFTPGSEASGRVIALGEGAPADLRGKRVAGFVMGGGLAEKALMMANACAIVPEDFDPTAAAAALINYGTAIYGFEDCGALKAGETMLVLGAAGGVGMSAIQIAKIAGAKVIAAASTDEKCAFCKQLGADETINYSNEDLRERLKELTGGKGPDVIYDPVGGPFTEPAFRSIAWRGRHLVVGFAAGDIPAIKINLALVKGASIVGVFWGDFARREPAANAAMMQELAGWYAQGRIKPLIDRTMPMSELKAAYARLGSREVMGKLVLVND